MINTASIRAAATALPGDLVGISKAQLDELLDEIEICRSDRRALKMQLAVAMPQRG